MRTNGNLYHGGASGISMLIRRKETSYREMFDNHSRINLEKKVKDLLTSVTHLKLIVINTLVQATESLENGIRIVRPSLRNPTIIELFDILRIAPYPLQKVDLQEVICLRGFSPRSNLYTELEPWVLTRAIRSRILCKRNYPSEIWAKKSWIC